MNIIMAQVQKFQEGGYLQIGNKKYTYDQITEYINQADFSPAERSAIADVVSSINTERFDNAEGKFNVRHLDRNANTLSGYDIKNDLLDYYGGNERKLERNMNGRSEKWANRQARRNSIHHVMNSAISKLGAIEDYYDQKEKDEAEKAKEKNILHKIDDPDGFYTDGVFDENSPQNIRNLKRIGRIFDALALTDRTGYNLVQWDDKDTLDGLVDWAEQNPDYKDGLITRLKNNTLTSTDKEILTLMGATFDSNQSNSTYLPGASGEARKWADELGLSFEQKDGRWTIDDPAGSRSQGVYLTTGDPVFAGTNWADTYIIDGNLYTRAEIAAGAEPLVQEHLGSFLSAADGGWPTLKDYYDAMASNNISYYGKSDNNPYGGFGHVDLNQFQNTEGSVLSSSEFKQLFQDNPFIMDLTNQYSIQDPNGIGNIYVIPTKQIDDLGRPKLKYVYARLNNDGMWFIKDFDSLDTLTSGISGVTITDLKKPYVGNTQFNLKASKQMRDGKYYQSVYDNENIQIYLLNGQYWMPFGDSMKKIVNTDQMYKYIDRLKDNDGTNNPSVNDWDKIVEHKLGGKIKPIPSKFQFGGNVGKANTKVEIEAAPEQVVSELSKTHKLNTSTVKTRGLNAYEDVKKSFEEDITEAERQQLRGAVYDLLGVAASFIPAIGNVLGAGLGVAGTWQTFKGDVNKDGFQLSDLGSAAVNLLMDVGSLIPFAGKAIKATKAFKGIKAASKVIMKLFVLNGITSGYDAIQKVINGEDIGTDEAIDILRGLTSTAIGAKMVKNQLGDAKLSKQLEEEVLKTKNASIKDTPEVTIRGKQIKADIDKIQGKTKAKVEEYLKKRVKDELGADFKEGVDDVDLSKKFGVTYDKEEFKWKKLGRRKEVGQFVPEEEQEAHSLLRHFISPNLRTKYIGGYNSPMDFFGDRFWNNPFKYHKGYLHLITPEQVSTAAQNAKSWKGFSNSEEGSSLINEAILRKTWESPKEFSFDLGQPQLFTDKGGRWYLGRNVKPTDSKQSTTEVPKQTPKPVTVENVVPEPSVEIIPKTTIEPVVLAPTPQVLIGAPKQQMLIGAPSQQALRTHNAHSRHIIPEQSVIEVPRAYSNSIYDLADLGNYAKSGASQKDLYAYAAWVLQSNGIAPTPAKVGDFLEKAALARQLPLDYLKCGGKVSKKVKKAHKPTDKVLAVGDDGKLVDKIDASGTSGDKPVGFGNFVGDYTPHLTWKSVSDPLLDFGRASAQLAGNTIGLSNQKNTFNKNIDTILKTDYVTPTEYYQPYSSSGILESAKSESKKLNNLNYYNPTSDPIVNRQVTSDVNSQNRSVIEKAQLGEAQHNINWENKFISDLTNNAKVRSAIINQNTQKDLGAIASKTQNDNAYVASLLQQINGYVGDVSNIIKKPAAKKRQLDMMNYQWKYQDWYRNANEYYKKQKEAGDTKASTFDAFLYDPANKELLKEYRSYQMAPLSMKKGGKTRPVHEMIKLENNKHQLKEISRLSKQAYELLKSALK